MGINAGRCVLLAMSAIALAFPGQAQTLAQTDSSTTPPISTSAKDLLIVPRAGASYNTSGGGYDGFGSLQGFIPLYQTPGKDLLYLVGQLMLDNDANLGGNAILGYRYYSPGGDRIFGGYLAYDNRNTNNNGFAQFGLGLETLGSDWDARLNAYIPVGKTRQTVSEQLFDTSLQVSNLRFTDHYLAISGSRQQRLVRDVEAAMAGFDAEAGGRILNLGETGELRGYAGLYYLAAGETAVGVRGRLEARPWDYLTVGLGVQHDRIFGTNVVATVALTFPSSRPSKAQPRTTLARMGELPYRNNAIVVDRQREVSDTSITFTDLFLTNPATGQPYFFQHVTLGTTGGNGTFESPFGIVQSALNATRSDGNDIVYVQAETNPGIPAFTIPNRVQVLSTGPIQTLPATLLGQFFPAYQLPLSGSGAYPNVNGTVTMGSDTVLSGFRITSTTGPGVTFTNVNQVDVRDNFIQNTAGAGIAGNGAAIANLFRNTITGTATQGINVQDIDVLTITDSAIANTGNSGITGIDIGTANLLRNTITGTVAQGINIQEVDVLTIADSVIANTGDSGILGIDIGTANLLRNTITAATNQGIYLQTVDLAIVTDNTISNTVAGTTTIANPITGDISLGPVTIPNPGSIIPLPSGQGIVLSNVSGQADVLRNTIAGTGRQGIVALQVEGKAAIANNTIANTVGADFATTVPNLGTIAVPTGQGIVVAGVNGTVDVTQNTISNVRGQGITVAGALNSTTSVTSNIIQGAVDQGIVIAGTSGTTAIANNQIRNVATRNVSIPNPTSVGPATLVIPTGQGLALLNAIGTVDITGNTIEQVRGAFASTPPAPDSGQGIAVANFAGNVTLNVANNQIRNNFNDGVLLVFAGRPTATTTAATGTVAITGNTIENNGNATPPGIRGDGIGIGLEQDAVINNLQITGNTIRNNGDEGIDIRLGLQAFPPNPASPTGNLTSAQLTGTIQNNAIAGNGQNGVQVEARGGTTTRVDIASNTVSNNNASGTGQGGILVRTTNIPLIGVPQVTANIRLNTLTANTGAGFQINTTTVPLSAQRICVNLTGNTSTTPSQIANAPNVPINTLQVVNLPTVNATNTGGVGTAGVITNVPACP